MDDNGNSLKGIAQIIVAKHRNGAVGEISLKFREEFAKFSDLDAVEPIYDDFDESPVVTIGSKMNAENSGDSSSSDISFNTGFEDQPF